jgi:drug/metabolite transporter (DMT)-like permease
VAASSRREAFGVVIAIVSCLVGGAALAVTRYLTSNADALTIAFLRWGIGILCLLPVALLLRSKFPPRKDWLPVAALGVSFFGIFFVLYNIALLYTTAARGSLALATLPLQTMLVASALGMEPLTIRKTAGVCIAVFGVAAALAFNLGAPAGAWRGEAIMLFAVFCMAFYSVWSRPFTQRSSAIGFLSLGMGSAAIALLIAGLLTGSLWQLASFGSAEWKAAFYLGIGGGAVAFILWILALERASPTRVSNTMTVNPIAAGGLGALLLGEPITVNLVVGLIAVFAGIWIATTEPARV